MRLRRIKLQSIEETSRKPAEVERQDNVTSTESVKKRQQKAKKRSSSGYNYLSDHRATQHERASATRAPAHKGNYTTSPLDNA